MFNFNLSSLFGGSGSSGLGSFNFSDYNMIRKGTYRKLMKAYYAKDKTTKSSKTDQTSVQKAAAKDTKDTTGLSKMKSQADSLKNAAQAFDKSNLFKQENGAYDTDKIAKAVNDFVNQYNSTIEQSGKVISKDVVQQTNYMKSMTNTMTTALSKTGITVGTDGKLSLSEDTLKAADMKDVKALFSGSHSYAADIANKAAAVGSAAMRSASTYTSSGSLSSSLSNLFNNWV